jgi:hypothetical protein
MRVRRVSRDPYNCYGARCEVLKLKVHIQLSKVAVDEKNKRSELLYPEDSGWCKEKLKMTLLCIIGLEKKEM